MSIEFKIDAHTARPAQVISVFKDGKFVATIVGNADNEDALRIISDEGKGALEVTDESHGPFQMFKVAFK